MNFVTTSFVLFFLPVLCIGWALRSRPNAFKYVLIAAGLFFYSRLGIEYLALLMLVAFLNWGCVKWMSYLHSRTQRRIVLAKNIILHVLILAFFKYAEPLFLWLNDMLGGSPLQQWLAESGMGDVVLPAGLSFYTFQGLSYAIDHFRAPERPARSFSEVLAYVSFFPTLLAGPIMREQDFLPQLAARQESRRDFNEGMALILSGLFKKVALSTFLSEQLVDPFFQDPENFSSQAALVGIYAYSIQIYLDFSGYSDLAIGIGRLMGFRLPQNFDAPYRSLSLQDFWHRWHISLSRWLRDYLYIPMGGSRRGNRYVNLTVTMVIGGLWHGSGLNFFIWGLFHGLGLVLVHAYGQIKAKYQLLRHPEHPWARGILSIISWFLTFHFVTVLWVFFRAKDFDGACRVFQAVTQTQEGMAYPIQVLFIIALGLGMQWLGPVCYRAFSGIQARLPWPVQAIIVGLLGGIILNLGPEGVLPFIYFSF